MTQKLSGYPGMKGGCYIELKTLQQLFNPGQIKAFRGEYKLLQRQGLIEEHEVGDLIYLFIPNLNELIWAVDAYYATCYAPGCDE